MIVSGAQGKSLNINPGKETIELALIDENDNEMPQQIWMLKLPLY